MVEKISCTFNAFNGFNNFSRASQRGQASEGKPVRHASAVSQLRGVAELGQSFVLHFISIKIVSVKNANSFGMLWVKS